MNTFAYGLKVIYKQKGFTQEQLAERVDMAKNTINKIVTGRINTTTENVDVICEALNVTPMELYEAGYRVKQQLSK